MIEVKNLSFSYKKNTPKVLDDITCDLEQGHMIAILGNNGAGKSTLLKCLNRINKINSGRIFVNGKDVYGMSLRSMAQQIAFVPQRSEPTKTLVFDAILLGRRPYIQWDITSEDKQIVNDVIRQMGLEKYASRHLNELSGGELQKVVLARALAQQPEYLLLDEPTSALDPKNQHEILRIVQKISCEQNISVMIVIHDLDLAVRYCDRFLLVADSEIYSYGDLSTVTEKAIKDVYDLDVDIIEYNNKKLVVAR